MTESPPPTESIKRAVTTREQAPTTKVITSPSDNDVLVGRGKSVQRHPGNIAFLEKIDELLDTYHMCRRGTKQNVVNMVWDWLLSTGGHFVKPVGEGKWVEIEKPVAIEKIALAFRHRRIDNQNKQKRDEEKRLSMFPPASSGVAAPASPFEMRSMALRAGDISALHQQSDPSLLQRAEAALALRHSALLQHHHHQQQQSQSGNVGIGLPNAAGAWRSHPTALSGMTSEHLDLLRLAQAQSQSGAYGAPERSTFAGAASVGDLDLLGVLQRQQQQSGASTIDQLDRLRLARSSQEAYRIQQLQQESAASLNGAVAVEEQLNLLRRARELSTPVSIAGSTVEDQLNLLRLARNQSSAYPPPTSTAEAAMDQLLLLRLTQNQSGASQAASAFAGAADDHLRLLRLAQNNPYASLTQSTNNTNAAFAGLAGGEWNSNRATDEEILRAARECQTGNDGNPDKFGASAADNDPHKNMRKD